MSFRLRLTLSVAAAVALAVAVACMIAYIVVGRQLYSQVDSSLRDEAGAVRGRVRAAERAPWLSRTPSTTGSGCRPTAGSAQPRIFAAGHASGHPAGARRRPQLVVARVADMTRWRRASARGDVLGRRRPLGADRAPPQRRRHRALAAAAGWFLLVAAGGVALAALLGAFVAREALRPVRRLTEDGRARRRDARPDAADRGLGPRRAQPARDQLQHHARRARAGGRRPAPARRRRLPRAAHAAHQPAHELRGAACGLGRCPEESRRKLEQDVHRQFDELAALVGDIVELARDGQSPAEEDDVRLDVLVAEAVERAERNANGVGFRLIGPADARAGRTRPARPGGDATCSTTPPSGARAARWSRSRSARARSACATTARASPTTTCRSSSTASTASAEARSMPGSGLGLAIVRQVAEAHGGHVTVEAPADGGQPLRARGAAAARPERGSGRRLSVPRRSRQTLSVHSDCS